MGKLLQAAFTQTKAPEKKFSATDLIPTAGGVIGGLIGSLGGPVGAVGGGAAGSALAEALRQKIVGENTNYGSIAKEGGLGLLGGAVGEGLGLAGRALGIGAKAAGREAAEAAGTALADTGESALAKTVAKAGAKDIAENQNLFTRIGTDLKTGVVKPKVTASPFGDTTEKEIVSTLDKLGIKGSAKSQYQQLGTKFDEISGKIANKLESNTTKFSRDEVSSTILKQLKESPLLSVTDETISKYESALSKLGGKDGTITAKELFKYKQNLGKELTKAFSALDNPAAALTPNQEAGLAVWKNIDNLITKADPSIKNLTKLQSVLFDASPGLSASRKAVSTIPILGTKIPNTALQAVQDRVGGALIKAGENTAIPRTAGQIAKNAALGQSTVGLLSPTGQQPDLNTVDSTQIDQGTTSGDTSLPELNPAQSQPKSTGGLTPELLQQLAILDLAKTGGKNLAKIQVLQSIIKSTSPSEAKNTKLSDTAIKTVSDLQNGIRQLNELETILKSSENITGPIMGRIRGANPFDTEAQSVQAAINLAKQTIGKALEGGVLRKEDEAKYEKILPTIKDSPSVAKQKITLLRVQLNENLQKYVQLQNERGAGVFNQSSVSTGLSQ